MIQILERTTTYDQQNRELFSTLVRDYELNSLTPTQRSPAIIAKSDIVPPHSKEHRNYIGETLLRNNHVGAVILAGGLASRFNGVPKASFELAPGWPMLKIKLELLNQLAKRFAIQLTVVIIASEATRESVLAVVEKHPMHRLNLYLLQQSMFPRLAADLPTQGTMQLAQTAPPGHGETLRLLQSVKFQIENAPAFWQVSNIDNLLVDIAPDIIGWHVLSGACATLEVVTSTRGDTGGFIGKGSFGYRVFESFELGRDSVETIGKCFSTNTFLVGNSALVAGNLLPFHAVNKKDKDGHNVVQFEQLMGDIGTILPVDVYHVDREGPNCRFLPLKTPEDLEGSRHNLLGLLREKGIPLP